MLKKLVASVVVLLGVAFAVAWFYLDRLIVDGIELVGTEVLGTEVAVQSASISPLAGTGSISGLTVDNPEGWSADSIFELEQVSVSVDVASLFSEVVEIDSIVISQPQITYETRLTSDNVRALLENLLPQDSGGTEAADSPGKSLIVRRFRIEDALLSVNAAAFSAPVTLPVIELTDIGTENSAATVAQLVDIVLTELSRAIARASLPGLDELRESVEAQVQERVEEIEETIEDTVEESVQGLENRLRNILPSPN